MPEIRRVHRRVRATYTHALFSIEFYSCIKTKPVIQPYVPWPCLAIPILYGFILRWGPGRGRGDLAPRTQAPTRSPRTTRPPTRRVGNIPRNQHQLSNLTRGQVARSRERTAKPQARTRAECGAEMWHVREERSGLSANAENLKRTQLASDISSHRHHCGVSTERPTTD